jgi:hypothetical protein
MFSLSIPPIPTLISVRDLYISRIGLSILLQQICGLILKPLKRHINVEIETEAAQFPEKEYINGIFVAVRLNMHCTQVWIAYFNFLFCFGLCSKTALRDT